MDFVLGGHFLLSVHTAGWDPESAHQLKLGIEMIMGRGWTSCCGRSSRIVDGVLPGRRAVRDEIREVQDESVAEAEKAGARAGNRAQARAHADSATSWHPSREI